MRRTVAAIMTVALATVGAIATASSASAEGVWHQAFERPSADAPCTSPVDETAWQDSFSGQKEWSGSWAEWANGGRGGWVCEREIVWAGTIPAGGPRATAGCVYGSVEALERYFNFGGSWFIEPSTSLYTNAACTTVGGSTTVHFVYAPAGSDADALCQEATGDPAAVARFNWGEPVGCSS